MASFLQKWLQGRNSSGDPDEFRLSLVEHLDELRHRIIRCLIIMFIAWVIGWIIFDPIYLRLVAHMKELMPKNTPYEEVLHGFAAAFMLKMKVSFYFGLFLAAPFIVYQLWAFIAPGLKENERRPMRIVGPLSTLLFAMGCYFSWLILPSAVGWFVGFSKDSFPDTKIMQDAGSLVFFVINMMFAFGLGFQLPIVVYFLAMVGILPPETLGQYWRHAVVVIFIVAAIVTPSVDPISMLMMALPLSLLFLLSVLAVKITKRKRSSKKDDDDQIPD